MARVLVIDDEPKLRQTIRQMLQAANHDVIEAENGVVGLKAMREHRPQIIITDIIMPHKEGVETIIEMTREAPDVRIIAMSGGGRTGNLDFLKLARKLGARATLTKPFRMAELLQAVEDVLAPSASGAT